MLNRKHFVLLTVIQSENPEPFEKQKSEKKEARNGFLSRQESFSSEIIKVGYSQCLLHELFTGIHRALSLFLPL